MNFTNKTQTEVIEQRFFLTFPQFTQKTIIREMCQFYFDNLNTMSEDERNLFQSYLKTCLDIEYLGNGIFKSTFAAVKDSFDASKKTI